MEENGLRVIQSKHGTKDGCDNSQGHDTTLEVTHTVVDTLSDKDIFRLGF